MGRAISRAELAGSTPVFYLSITWGGKTYNFSSVAIDVHKNDGSIVSYTGGLPDPDYATSLDMLGSNPEAGSIPIQITFDVDLVEQLMRYGRSLDTATGELGMYGERAGNIIQTYEDRIRLFSGNVVDPIIGEPSRPVGYVAFSLERLPNMQPDRIIAPHTVITREHFGLTPLNLVPYKTVNNSIGKNWPVIIGRPGAQTEQPGIAGGVNNYDQPGSPAYFISATKGVDAHNTDTTVNLLIAAGSVDASTVQIIDYVGNVSGNLAVSEVNIGNRVYSQVIFSQAVDGLYHPWLLPVAGLSFRPEFSIATVDEPKYWVIWNTGGGLPNPFGEGAITGAGDLIRYGLTTTNVDVDLDSWNNISDFLNNYEFSAFVIDDKLTWWDWLSDFVLPFVPVQVVNGPDGLRAVLPLFYGGIYATPRTSITVGRGFKNVSALDPINERSDIVNELRISYCFQPQNEALSNRLEINGESSIGHGAFLYGSEVAVISRNRYGSQPADLELPAVYKLATATGIADYVIRRDALIKRALVIEADPVWGWLEPGDVVAISSTDLFLTDHRVQLSAKAWTGESWEFIFVLEENPATNIRG